MSFDHIRSGSVIRYPYLWARQAAHGETAGRKTRPVAVVLRLSAQRGDALLVLPITSQTPSPERNAIEIPPLEKRRCGLDESQPLWIILDEYNRDIVGQSFHLLPEKPIGRFGKAFFLKVLQAFYAGRDAAKGISRLDG